MLERASCNFVCRILPDLRFNWMNTASYVDETSRDRIQAPGSLGYVDLGIKPVKVTEGLAVEMIR